MTGSGWGGAAVRKSTTQPTSPRLTRPSRGDGRCSSSSSQSACQSSLGQVPLELRGEGVLGNAQQYSPTPCGVLTHKCHRNRQDLQLIRTNHPITYK